MTHLKEPPLSAKILKILHEKFDSSSSLVGAQSTMHGGEGVEVRDQQEQLSKAGWPTVRSATALKSPILQELGPGQVPGDWGHVEGLA